MYDVFISYSTENQAEVNLIRQRLEDVGISCWFAPKEIQGNQDFTKIIPQAIRNSKAFLLLMSKSAQVSKWVFRELGEADACDLPIYTLFLEPCEMDERFKFILRFSQHYDASKGLELQLSRLIHDLVQNSTREDEKPKQKKKPLWPWLAAGAAVLVAAVVALVLLLGGKGVTDGRYVIWAPAHNMALSSESAKNEFYRAGERITQKNGKPTDYSPSCVWQVTFLDERTFTISYNGQPLGTTPDENGIAFGGDNTQIRWELIDLGDGTYHVRNVDSHLYLEWYDDKGNWCTHHDINDKNRDLFVIDFFPVK